MLCVLAATWQEPKFGWLVFLWLECSNHRLSGACGAVNLLTSEAANLVSHEFLCLKKVVLMSMLLALIAVRSITSK